MILLLRVDHRLLHGQVVFSWCSQLQPNCILIADDEVVKDDLRKSTLRLGKPQGVKLVFKSVNDAIEAINSGKTDKYRLLIVVPTIETAVILAKEVLQITAINLGGTKALPGTHPLSKMVNVTEHDEQILREISSTGKEVNIQAVPSDPKKILFK